MCSNLNVIYSKISKISFNDQDTDYGFHCSVWKFRVINCGEVLSELIFTNCMGRLNLTSPEEPFKLYVGPFGKTT